MKKKVLCTALAAMMWMTTTTSATEKPWWLSRYRVTFDNELGIVGKEQNKSYVDVFGYVAPAKTKTITVDSEGDINKIVGTME